MTSNFINTIVRILLLTLLPETLGQQWSFSFPKNMKALRGSCVEIPCSYTRPASLQTPNVIWYLFNRYNYIKVFDSQNYRTVSANYRSRTKLVLNALNSCTLHISNVRSEDEDYYYPGVDDYNAYDLSSRTVHLSITDTPNRLNLQVPREMAEGTPITIRCSVEHSCGSIPPTLRWNKRGHLVRTGQQPLSVGTWEAISEIAYTPTYEDDETEIQCSATYPNGQITRQTATLNIKYPPKNIKVLIRQKEIQEEDDVTLSCFSSSKLEINRYEWFKGVEKTKLPAEGKELTVRNVSWVTDPYSCSAWNSQGSSESALTLIPVQFAPKKVQIIKFENQDGSSMAEAPPFKMDDNVYDTINEGKYRVTSDSGSTSPLYSSSRKSKLLKKEDEDFYYYAADNKGQEEPEEVEYAAIGFSQHNQPNEASQQDGHHTEHAVYAILKN
ncbi:hypothetical protein XELAEV_18004278mg [Xenopus laevis]|uniref:Ig-like domain-containing protein n=1 Tax=Xenopus laevis TaxID=8355 RepID=A0A974BRY0_XENLA|nr:hypothetical protein XELAEV_18004278mg [Xenopus laevis]